MAIALPPLPLAEWKPTCDTLHMWTQIVGKVRLELAPRLNHWWEVPLYVSARGLTTSAIPCGDLVFDCEFDFVDHQLLIRVSNGRMARVALEPRSVADFYRETMARLRECGIDVSIRPVPCEVDNPIPFGDDHEHASYDRDAVERFWRVLMFSDRVLNRFRASFIGKSSPVHFFWGSFDLAATRFSGRRAPENPQADPITREAYSHEVSSCGWWPGGGALEAPAFYSYAAPQPEGFKTAKIEPPQAFYSDALSQFILPYDAVRESPDPEDSLLRFCQTTYAAAADAGGWDRAALERAERDDD
ncbi:MAG: hypothetical protein QOC81_3434 [Thermoanaerobaculia bacterium]|jgi:hypothetical protein|nr:hypothetical protein [Thermoanaerobaculia bacterium]